MAAKLEVVAPQEDEPPKAKISTIRVELEGRYAGWWADCDDDPDGGFLADLGGSVASGLFGPAWEALERVVVRWNFTDRQGQPLQPDRDGMRRVPAKALLNLAKVYMQTWGQLPN